MSSVNSPTSPSLPSRIGTDFSEDAIPDFDPTTVRDKLLTDFCHHFCLGGLFC